MALGLQYQMELDRVTLNIFSEGFAGEVTSLIGSGDNPIEYESQDVDSPYEALRGGSLNVKFKATIGTPQDTLYAEDEKYYYAELLYDNALRFKGYVIPDGVLQSFVFNEWETSFQIIDGLSMLENYEYSQMVGVSVNGRYTLKDVVCACLAPLNFPSDSIYVSADIKYLGTPVDTDVFDWIRVSNERYLQADQETPMDCRAVLKSILEPFGLMIVQHLGHWYIVSQGGEMLQTTGDVQFYRYRVNNGEHLETVQINPNKVLAPEWSETKDYYHINANQELSTARAIKIARMRYELGARNNTLSNPTFLVSTGPDPDDWTVEADIIDFTFLDPGMVIRHVEGSGRNPAIASNAGLNISAGNGGLTLTLYVFGTSANEFPFFVKYSIQVGTNWYNAGSGNWDGTTVVNKVGINSGQSQVIEIKTTPPPADGDLRVRLYEPEIINTAFDDDIQLIFSKATISQGLDTGLRAWVYRYENPGNILSIPDPKTVYNGDGEASLLGTLYENDGTTPTEGISLDNHWVGPPIIEDPLNPSLLDLLDIIAARIGHSTRSRQYVYDGDVYGIVPYLSAIGIEGLEGKFFPTGLTINYAKGVSTVKIHQLHDGMMEFSEAAARLTKEPEYQNTIKPVING